MKYVSLFAIILLAGCVAPEEQARRATAYELSECAGLGFKAGTEAFANCRLQIRGLAAQERSRRIAAFGAIQQMQQTQQMNRPRSCFLNGNMMNCY